MVNAIYHHSVICWCSKNPFSIFCLNLTRKGLLAMFLFPLFYVDADRNLCKKKHPSYFFPSYFRMVIYLPLLFAAGRPTSLDIITAVRIHLLYFDWTWHCSNNLSYYELQLFPQSQLERFIPFMLSCCPEASNGPPIWWESAVPYKLPLCRTPNITPEVIFLFPCRHVISEKLNVNLANLFLLIIHYRDGYSTLRN